MKKIAKEMPLAAFIDRMNSLNQPFTVEAFFFSGNEDIGSTEIECHLIDVCGQLMLFRGNHSIVHISKPCKFVKWDDNETMMCYVMGSENVIVKIYTPDSKPLKVL